MRRRVFRRALLPVLALAALAALLGACKATDTSGGLSGVAAGPQAKTSAPATSTTEVNADGVRRVTVAELQKLLDDGNTVIYDTRARTAYDAEHIKGSLSMPFDEVSKRAGELPREKTLVFYCT